MLVKYLDNTNQSIMIAALDLHFLLDIRCSCPLFLNACLRPDHACYYKSALPVNAW